MGFGELVLVIIVAIVMIGPKDLPKVLRTLGQWAGKLRRMALDLRVQSGIDDVLRHEGLTEDLQEIRKLARGEFDGIRAAATVNMNASSTTASNDEAYGDISMAALRHREYPREGADSFDAMPDTAMVYADSMPRSALARDPLYVTGDPNGVLPELPPEAPVDSAEAPPLEVPAPAPGPAQSADVGPPAVRTLVGFSGEAEPPQPNEPPADATVGTRNS